LDKIGYVYGYGERDHTNQFANRFAVFHNLLWLSQKLWRTSAVAGFRVGVADGSKPEYV
jgi:hypothetical protein